ncbi:MAG: cysteine desulfurase, partial [Flavobacteriia bacterium]|nr:cysteine desulfurase [Flavobacteriia bacterium]
MRVYLDNAATTPMAPEVVDAMCEVLKNDFGNPSSTHAYGRSSKALLETSRRNMAKHLNCQPSELFFTSGGTEADNLACHIAVLELGVQRIISTSIEHHAVGHTVEMYSDRFKVQLQYLTLDAQGHIDLKELEALLKEPIPTLVTLMHANNEIATLIPLEQVANLCRTHGAYFHSDTVQTMGHYAFDLRSLDIDFITCAAHKFHGPKGIGFLYVNKRIKMTPLILGGSQERGFRGGTENIAGVVGMSKAFDLAYEDVQGHQAHVQGLKSYMIERLSAHFSDLAFHGDTTPSGSLYTVLNVCFPPTEK